jgi:predicted Rossmann fold flavoprotein
MWDVLVIGAGAAGLLAAIRAGELGRRVLVLEKNRKPGVKILMSGGTRCNLTHATDKWGIVKAFGEQGNFLHSALAALSPSDLVELFEAEGVATKTEETGKVFPVSNKAVDVLDALLHRFRRSGANLALDEGATLISRSEDGFLIQTPGRALRGQRLIITTGGQSYPGSGTTGDGYAWAQALGHTIVPTRPALVPLTSGAAWIKALKGVTIPDVNVRLQERPTQATPLNSLPTSRRPLAERRGSFLFTHFGLSGPAVLDVSRAVTGHSRPALLQLNCDFLPNVPMDRLTVQLQSEAAAAGKKHVAAILSQWAPRRLSEALLEQTGISLDRRGAELSRSERQTLVHALKGTAIPLSGALGFEKAEVTAGGVLRDEVDSRTMQSKLVPGLYFAGEVLDLDGPIGGYNFQSAFSTGWLAGTNA